MRYVAGGLGLGEWLAETDDIVRKSGEVPTELNYELAFDVAISTSLNPEFSRTTTDGVSPNVETDASDDRRVRHRIAVTLLPVSAPGRTVTDEAILDASRGFLDRLATR